MLGRTLVIPSAGARHAEARAPSRGPSTRGTEPADGDCDMAPTTPRNGWPDENWEQEYPGVFVP
jgi:hypothetical protein